MCCGLMISRIAVEVANVSVNPENGRGRVSFKRDAMQINR